jgi:hypothetical protein
MYILYTRSYRVLHVIGFDGASSHVRAVDLIASLRNGISTILAVGR